MSTRCAVCGQPLPVGVSEAEMHRRLDKLRSEAADREVAKARREIDRRYRIQLTQQAKKIRQQATKDAQAGVRHQVSEMERRLRDTEAAAQKAIAKAAAEAAARSRRELEALQRQLKASDARARQTAERAAKKAAKDAAAASRRELSLVKERAERERAQHTAETGRLKATVDTLSLKLERQTSEQLGEFTEAEALAALRAAFPHDEIHRVGPGVRGADIIQKVRTDGVEVGRIVYECKNATSWKNEWLTKARSYRAEYQTPWVVIASRCFPRREKWFCVERDIPIIHLSLTVRLAEVIRGAVVQIGSLRASSDGRQAKADEMFAYIISDQFKGRFQSIAAAVSALREQQGKERQYHNETWSKQTRFFDEIDGGRREIEAQVRAIAEAPTREPLRVVSGTARGRYRPPAS